MPLFRLLTTGVCVACVVALATIEPVRVEVIPRAVVHDHDRAPPVSVLDVAHGVAPGALAALVHLRPNEWVSAINDRALYSDLPADWQIALLAPHAGEFLDLTVSSATAERRVLVLVH